MKIAFTGHRPNKLGGYDDKTNKRTEVLNKIQKYLSDDYIKEMSFISGMALGVDQWIAEFAIEKNIDFDAYIPFKGQELAWPKSSQEHYHELLKKAKNIKYICEPGYAPWKMQKRNESMVNDCDILIAVWDESSGGTANCVKYAEKMKKTIYRIIP